MKTINYLFFLVFLFVTGVKANAQATTYVPDDNFEQALIDFGYDDVLDDYVLTANINTVTNLYISERSISDLTSIEDFTALEYLSCGQNNLTSLSVSSNIALSTLDCYGNNLTSLDVSSNSMLTYLSCDRNNLTSLDVSSNTSLINLFCYENNIEELDVSENTSLIKLWCYDNNLTTLNVKNGNNLNMGIFDFDSRNNPDLTCIQVDDVAYSTTYWTFIDQEQYFSEDCSLNIEDFTAENLSVFPNPTNNYFQIETVYSIQEVTLYNTLGKIVAKYHLQDKYDVSNLEQGVYFILVKSDDKILNGRIIIN